MIRIALSQLLCLVRSIKAITWDVGGTLLTPWPSVGHVYAEVAAEHGFTGADPEMLNRQFAEAWKARQHFDHTRAAWADLVRKTFYGLDAAKNQEISFFDAVYERFTRASAWRLFDDVVPTLQALRENGLQMAVVSNWDERLHPLLAELNLTRFFEVVCVSLEVGHHKPAPQIFLSAVAAMGLKPEECLHIGDTQKEDTVGASAAGLPSLLIKRTAKDGPQAGEIRSLLDLPPLLEKGIVPRANDKLN